VKEKKSTVSAVSTPRKVELRRGRHTWVIVVKDEADLMSATYRPIRTARVRRTIGLSDLNMLTWAGVLGTTASKLETRLEEETELTAAEAERIDLFEQTYARGVRAFGNEEKFKRWMEIPSPALGHMKPKDMMKNTSGLRNVMAELEDIAYGTYA